MFKSERAVEGIRMQLAKRPQFNLEQAFASCDTTYDGVITQTDVSLLFN
jgi:hypothetical protein